MKVQSSGDNARLDGGEDNNSFVLFEIPDNSNLRQNSKSRYDVMKYSFKIL